MKFNKSNIQQIVQYFKHNKNTQWALLLFLIGIVIVIFSSFRQSVKTTSNQPIEQIPADKTKEDSPSTLIKKYEQECEQQLAHVLSKVVGVDDVTIMVNMDSDEILEVANETRESNQVTNELIKSGGNRSVNHTNTDKKVAHYRSNNNDLPVIVKRVKPKVRGVLIVARGVEDLAVKSVIIEAVQRTLDLPVHRISVLPKGH